VGRVYGLRFRFQVSRVKDSGFSVSGSGFRVQRLRFRVSVRGCGSRVEGLGFRVHVSDLRVNDLGFSTYDSRPARTNLGDPAPPK
jgi:hypothetical protein